jgi:hypothetical protein
MMDPPNVPVLGRWRIWGLNPTAWHSANVDDLLLFFIYAYDEA